jgi:hypothetical protein
MSLKFATTTLKFAVHREDVNPVFGEGVTFVSVDDEAGGPFLVIEQDDDDVKPGTVRFDYEEFLAVAEAAKTLMHQVHIKQADKS